MAEQAEDELARKALGFLGEPMATAFAIASDEDAQQLIGRIEDEGRRWWVSSLWNCVLAKRAFLAKQAPEASQ